MIKSPSQAYGESYRIKEILDEFVRSGYLVALVNGAIVIDHPDHIERYGVALHNGELYHIDGSLRDSLTYGP